MQPIQPVRRTTATDLLLWTAQTVLALLFLFAGGMKLVAPAAELTRQIALPIALLRFVGVVETLGALGLALPGLFRVQRRLTPAAAAGLVIVMSGAVGVTLAAGQGVLALVPAVVGVLAAIVAVGRRAWLTGTEASRASAARARVPFARATV